MRKSKLSEPVTAMRSVAVAASICVGPSVVAEEPHEVVWSRQFGTSEDDFGGSVAVDTAGNAYICGWTQGSLFAPFGGIYDAFVAKFNPAGDLLWSQQLRTSGSDLCNVAIDQNDNLYVSGATSGSLFGARVGGLDAFMARYDARGSLLWSRQFGTEGYDAVGAVAFDIEGNPHVAGVTDGDLGGTSAGGYDVFVAKHDAAGEFLWSRQFGSAGDDLGGSIGVDSAGNVYLTGVTSGSLAGPSAGGDDAFLAKYDASGEQVWLHQFGTADDEGNVVLAVDADDNVYVSGSTFGALGGTSAGAQDVFLAKYDPAGGRLWLLQIGTSASDTGYLMDLDAAGSIFLSGVTRGSFGAPLAGRSDAFVARVAPMGDLLWVRQIGSSSWDQAVDVAVSPSGEAFISGSTGGSLAAPAAGGGDVILIKLAPAASPCPADCDASGALDFFDFLCFQALFADGELEADCDGSGELDLFDFLCFQNSFAAGCP